jgi:protein phosphatase
MGDTPRSACAAQAVVQAVRELFLEPWVRTPRTERSPSEAERRLRMGVTQANGRLYAPQLPRERRTGATFAGMVDCGESFALGHVGDSRVHLLRARRAHLVQLVQDHTVAASAERRGVHREIARRHPDAHKLTRAIGMRSTVKVETATQRWESGDMVLLSTDGVSDPLDIEAMTTILLDARDLDEAARALVGRALERGGSDNATVLLVHRIT